MIPQRQHRRRGFSLIELIAAVVLIAAVAAVGIQHVRTSGETGLDRSCELTRQVMQAEVDRYVRINRRLPSSDLRELRSAEYWGAEIPLCPATNQPLTIDRQGNVLCGSHTAP